MNRVGVEFETCMFVRRGLAGALNTKDLGEPSQMLCSAPARDSHRYCLCCLQEREEESTRRRQHKTAGRIIACMGFRRCFCLAPKDLGKVHGQRRECYCMTRQEWQFFRDPLPGSDDAA